MTYNLVKVARAPVTVCLQCPLCCNLVHEATTISECLHTFCRDCIWQRLGDGESDCCPICNVNLGCSPLEKLRADHQLDDVRAKIFPVKSKKRRVIDKNVDCDAPAPVKRKERSLSSLGIGAVPPSANPGFVSRRTKSVSTRLLTTRDKCADNEFDDNKLEKGKAENFGTGRECSDGGDTNRKWHEEYSSDGESGPVSEGNQASLLPAKKEIISDEDKETTGTEALQSHKADHFVSCKREMLPHSVHKQSRWPTHCSNGGNLSFKLGMHLAERSKISSTGLHTRATEMSDQPDNVLCKPDKTEPYDGVDQELPAAFPVVRSRSGKDLKRRSALAQLAELAVGQAVESSEPTKPSGLRARRSRGKTEKPKNHAVCDNSNWPSVGRNVSAGASPVQSSFPPLVKSSTPDKLPIIRKMSSSGRMPSNIAMAKHDERNTGFWFSLQASDNQFGDNALPQISTRYLCIKDGKLPVSIVKKYLVKKLDLKSETEVEITCRGQPVVPNLPLESVQGIWFNTMPSLDLLPSLKDVNPATYYSRKWNQLKGKSAEDYMMVLTYGRHRRPMIGH